jgi:cytochrome oxidase assembly protein ShyY1
VLDDGGAVLVDRGWVPSEVSEPPVGGEAAASSGPVSVDGILLPSREGDVAYEELPDQVRDVDAAALDLVMPLDLVTDGYVLLEHQTPATDRPIPAPLPEPTEGPHLSYAIQWFTFAAIALVGYGLLVRRDRRKVAAPQTASDERKG